MRALLALVFVCSGAAGLIYESIWSRYLGLLVGHSAYAQTIVLVIFLGGMAAGAALVGRRAERIGRPLLWYAAIEAVVGVIGLVFHDLFLGVSAVAYDTLFPALAGSAALQPVKWVLAGALILPQSVLLGATFPLMSAGVLRREPPGDAATGRVLALLYFANSLGAAAGVLLAGFWLLRLAGLPGTLVAAAIVNLVVALIAFAIERMAPGRAGASAAPEAAPAGDPNGRTSWESPEAAPSGTPAAAPAGDPNGRTSWESPEAAPSGTPAAAPAGDPDGRTSWASPEGSPDGAALSAPGAALSAPGAALSAPGATAASLDTTLLVIAGGTAVASFVYEIAWVRMLSLVLGSATHSFELMLSAFILGLALGAWWLRGRAERIADPIRTLALVQWAMGALAIATIPVYLASFRFTAWLLAALDRTDEAYLVFTVARYAICLAVMLPATVCAGMTLPLITRVLMRRGGERAIGRVYAVNTFGSIVGASAAALAFLPWLGLKTTLLLGGAMDMALGVWLVARGLAHRPGGAALLRATAVGAVAIVATVAVTQRFDRTLLTSGVYRYATVPEPGSRDIPFYKDGRTATVSVRRGGTAEDGNQSLATNGKPDASLDNFWLRPADPAAPKRTLTGDQSTQALLALTTLAHAPAATAAVVIGQGSGMTSHFLLGSPTLRELVTVDIEPAMLEGSRVFYPANRRVFDDPRAHFVIDDAKSFFAAAGRRFDLILSEPSNPWVSGVSGLFTDEFYARIRTYLTPGGVFGQWLHLYEIDDGLVLSVLAAIHRAFPAYAVYQTSSVDILVVATTAPALPTPDWSVLAAPAVQEDLVRFRPLPADVLDATWLADRAVLAPLIGDGAGANSDFYPTLDLGAERTRFRRTRAAGFFGLGTDRFDIAAALAGRTRGFADAPAAPFDMDRAEARARGARLRSGLAGDTVGGAEARAAAWRLARLRVWMAEGLPPTSWPLWVQEALQVEGDLHGGTAAVADDGFYAAVRAYCDRAGCPDDARAAFAFSEALARGDWPAARAAVAPLAVSAARRDHWVDPDLLRDGAVVAALRTGDARQARAWFDLLTPVARRPSEDLRTRLLEAWIRSAEAEKLR
jgi:predicted membrane-bound spermidine synthase